MDPDRFGDVSSRFLEHPEGGWTAYAPLNAHRAGHGPCHHGQDRSSPSSAATGPRT